MTPAPRPVVWITGASTGIGEALAYELAARGHIVAASARSAAKLHEMAAGHYGTGAIKAYPLDVTDAVATTRVIDAITQDLGGIAIAVLNAGGHIPQHGLDITMENTRALFDLNFFSVLDGLLKLAKAMRGKGGQIAVMASVAGYRGLPDATAYSASKAALISAAESLRPDCERNGIKLQLICPGFVKTPLTDKNKFPMPFLIPAAKAAKIIADGLASSRFEIVFPWPMMLLMKLIGVLPYSIFLPIMRKAGRAQPSE